MSTFLWISLAVVAFIIWAAYKLIKWMIKGIIRIFRDSSYTSSSTTYTHTPAQEPEPECSFQDGITENEFEELVLKATKHIAKKRLHDVSVDGSWVYGVVRSQTGISDWYFKIDFNDFGHLTGRYWISSDNDDSGIPEACARRISEEIHSRM